MAFFNRSTCVWLVAAVAVAALGGCSPGEPASLSGEVRYLEVPIATGGIRLFPLQGTPGRGAIARIVDGKYRMEPGEGLYVGNYRVEIHATRPTGRTIKEVPGEPAPTEPGEELESYLPAIYGTSSALRVELKPGENVRNFELLKDGEKLP